MAAIFSDNIFIRILLNENFWISNNISLKCLIDNVIIGSYNGLALNRRQAIIWTNDGLLYWCIYVSLNLSKLTH